MTAQIRKELFVVPGELDGTERDRGLLAFGPPPPRAQTMRWAARATGWRPIISSFGYSTLGEERPHRVQLALTDKLLDEASFEGSPGFVAGSRWQQVVFDGTASFVYLTNVEVPVSDESGQPFALRLRTEGRLDPSMVVLDWEWGQKTDRSLRCAFDALVALMETRREGRGR